MTCGPMMVEPGWKVYRGMIVGEPHLGGNDLEINVLKGKKLAMNIPQFTAKDEAVGLTPPIKMIAGEGARLYNEDELVEVTPVSIRLRKKLLANDRKARGAAQGNSLIWFALMRRFCRRPKFSRWN